MDSAPQKKKVETGQCNLDRAFINLNAIRDMARDEFIKAMLVRIYI